MAVKLPTDHLPEIWPPELGGARIGALLHPASVNSKLEHTARILEQENRKLFRQCAREPRPIAVATAGQLLLFNAVSAAQRIRRTVQSFQSLC